MHFETYEDFYNEFGNPDTCNFLIDLSEMDDGWMLYVAQPRRNTILEIIIDKVTRIQLMDWAHKSASILAKNIFVDMTSATKGSRNG